MAAPGLIRTAGPKLERSAQRSVLVDVGPGWDNCTIQRPKVCPRMLPLDMSKTDSGLTKLMLGRSEDDHTMNKLAKFASPHADVRAMDLLSSVHRCLPHLNTTVSCTTLQAASKMFGSTDSSVKGEAVEAVTQTADYEVCMHEGALAVTIVEVQGLANGDSDGGCDPYVRLGFGGQEYVTSTKMDVDFSGGSLTLISLLCVPRLHVPPGPSPLPPCPALSRPAPSRSSISVCSRAVQGNNVLNRHLSKHVSLWPDLVRPPDPPI